MFIKISIVALVLAYASGQSAPSCQTTRCTAETRCVLQQVMCFAPPCYPIPTCIDADLYTKLCSHLNCNGDCVVDPSLRAWCQAPSTLCPNGDSPLVDGEHNFFCGRGGKRCPATHNCNIASDDTYAVCCPISKVLPPPVSVCGPVCDIFCPNGNVMDSKGCPTCQCKTKRACPLLPCPLIFCPHGHVKDDQGCDTCQCAEPKCGPVCMIFCPKGNVMDSKGCPTCQCNPDPKPEILDPEVLVPATPIPEASCPPTKGMVGMCVEGCKPGGCPAGEACCSNGCGHVCTSITQRACPLLPCPLLFCPNGHVKDDQGCDTCQCAAPKCGPVCMIFCPKGNVLDSKGCPTCQCNLEPEVPEPDPRVPVLLPLEASCPPNKPGMAGICVEACSPGGCPAGKACCSNGCGHVCTSITRRRQCPQLPCPLCPNGYTKDEQGCDTCHCAEAKQACPPIPLILCPFGHVKDDQGCDTIKCAGPRCLRLPCPPRVCPNGYRKDSNGCDTCDCAGKTNRQGSKDHSGSNTQSDSEEQDDK